MLPDTAADVSERGGLGKWLAAEKGDPLDRGIRDDLLGQRVRIDKLPTVDRPSLRHRATRTMDRTPLNLNAGPGSGTFYISAGNELKYPELHVNRSLGHRFSGLRETRENPYTAPNPMIEPALMAFS